MRPLSPGAVTLRCVAALFLFAVPVAPLAAQNPEQDRPLLREVSFEGVDEFDDEVLLNNLAIEPSSCRNIFLRFTFCPFTRAPWAYERRYLEREELARDVLRLRAFYWRRGFRSAAVDTLVEAVEPDEVRVTFIVDEGPPTVVDTLALLGVAPVLDEERVRRTLALSTGEPLSYPALDSALAELRDGLWDQGYADAVIDTAVRVDTAARRAAVVIGVEPRWVARVGSIRVAGTERVAPDVVRRSLLFGEGDIFRRSELLRSQRNLYESNLFIRANIEAVSGDSVKHVVVNVREGDLQRVRLAAGFNTLDFLQVDARYTNYNFLGGARRLQLSAALGNLLASALEDEFIFKSVQLPADGFLDDRSPFLKPNWQASAEFQQRWWQDPRNIIGVAAFAHRRATPGVVIDRGQGGSVTFTRQVADRFNASANYRFEVTRVEAGDVYFCVNFGVCDPTTIRALSSAQKLSPAQLFSNVERVDDPLSPTRGYIASLGFEHASAYTASDFRYNRIAAEGSAYQPVGPGVLAGHLRVGWADALSSANEALQVGGAIDGNVLHPRKRFYSGGSRSVRGYGENQLGPRVLTIAPSRLEELGCEPPFLTCTTLNATDTDGEPLLVDTEFSPRPIGGSAIVEANVEYRYSLTNSIVLAGFLDGAILTAGDNALFSLDDNFMALTPGFGVRYLSPVGPIRVDLGYNPFIVEELPVLTQAEVDGERRIVRVGGELPRGERPTRRYAPGATADGWERLLYRFTLHLSIGEAF